MELSVQERRGWRTFWLSFGGLLALALGARAALVDLDAMVTYSIYDHTGSTPLADGSLVYIFGSSNSTIDAMPTAPMVGGTSYVAGSTTGDDILLGQVRIDSAATTSNGTFFTTIKYESTQVGYVYIRFFEFTNQLVGGMVYWGGSPIHQLSPTPTVGVNSIDFNPGATLFASNYNHFVVVPEPSTANLFLLVGGMAFVLRAGFRRKGGPGGGASRSGGPKP